MKEADDFIARVRAFQSKPVRSQKEMTSGFDPESQMRRKLIEEGEKLEEEMAKEREKLEGVGALQELSRLKIIRQQFPVLSEDELELMVAAIKRGNEKLKRLGVQEPIQAQASVASVRSEPVKREPRGGAVEVAKIAAGSVARGVQAAETAQARQQQKLPPKETPTPKAVHYVKKQVTQYTEHEAPKLVESKPVRRASVQAPLVEPQSATKVIGKGNMPPKPEGFVHKQERERIVGIIAKLREATQNYVDKYDPAKGGKKDLHKGKGYFNAKSDTDQKLHHAEDRRDSLITLAEFAAKPNVDLNVLKNMLDALIDGGLKQDIKDRGWTKGDVERDLKIAGHALDKQKYPDDPEKSSFSFGKKGH